MIARVDDCVQFVDEGYRAERLRMLYSEVPFPMAGQRVSDHEQKLSFKPSYGIDDVRSLPRKPLPRMSTPGDPEDSSTASLHNPMGTTDHLPHLSHFLHLPQLPQLPHLPFSAEVQFGNPPLNLVSDIIPANQVRNHPVIGTSTVALAGFPGAHEPRRDYM